MEKLLKIIVITFVFLASGCVQIPNSLEIIGNHYNFTEAPFNSSCLESSKQSVRNKGLNPERLKLLNWNIHKVREKGWAEDLKNLCHDCDIYTIQEGYLTKEFLDFFNSRGYRWNISSAFTYSNIFAGVLTASKVEPEFLCVFRESEPLLRVPKTALITRYQINTIQEQLMVVNIHSINYSLGIGSYISQLETLEEILMYHDGPLILAGDFNTWSVERQTIVDTFCRRFSLIKMEFPDGNVTTTFGNPIDHIYYRGLRIQERRAVEVSSSDHNPLLITFSILN